MRLLLLLLLAAVTAACASASEEPGVPAQGSPVPLESSKK
jgi:hypothetical protein